MKLRPPACCRSIAREQQRQRSRHRPTGPADRSRGRRVRSERREDSRERADHANGPAHREDGNSGRKFEGQPLQGPNDVTIDGMGRIYFTDLGGSAVYRIDAPEMLAELISAPDVSRPNGIQVSPDDKILYVADSAAPPSGVRVLLAYDLRSDGSVANKRTLYDFKNIRGTTDEHRRPRQSLHRVGIAVTNNTGVHVISPRARCSSSFRFRKTRLRIPLWRAGYEDART